MWNSALGQPNTHVGNVDNLNGYMSMYAISYHAASSLKVLSSLWPSMAPYGDSIGSGNGLLHDGTKPIHESMLT